MIPTLLIPLALETLKEFLKFSSTPVGQEAWRRAFENQDNLAKFLSRVFASGENPPPGGALERFGKNLVELFRQDPSQADPAPNPNAPEPPK